MLNINSKSNMVNSASFKGIDKKDQGVAEPNKGEKTISSKAKVAIGLGILGAIGLASVLIKKKCDSKDVHNLRKQAEVVNKQAKELAKTRNTHLKAANNDIERFNNLIFETDKAIKEAKKRLEQLEKS